MKNMVARLLTFSALFITVLYFFNIDLYSCITQFVLHPPIQTEQKLKKMRTFLLNKLWRDKMPEDMELKGGAIVHVTILDDEHYDKALRAKIVEEADEVAHAKTKDELISEIGDVLEVIACILEHHDLSMEQIEQVRLAKKEERGSFGQRKYVTIAEYAPGSFGEQYCMKDPSRHHEIFV